MDLQGHRNKKALTSEPFQIRETLYDQDVIWQEERFVPWLVLWLPVNDRKIARDGVAPYGAYSGFGEELTGGYGQSGGIRTVPIPLFVTAPVALHPSEIEERHVAGLELEVPCV